MIKLDPLDVHAMVEQRLAANSREPATLLSATLDAHPAAGLEAAAEYLNAGLWSDCRRVVEQMIVTSKSRISPLAYYYAGYSAQRLGRPDDAAKDYLLAAQQPTDYVFPFQMEMITVLEDAMHTNPADSRAPYYLGNLLYDWQPDRALALWEKSAELGADFPTVYRNLALVYARRENGRDKQLAALEKAVELGGSAMVLGELDKLYEENGVSPDMRLSLLEKHQPVINRDDIISREINLKIFAGKPDDAIALLKSRFFRSWEGGASYSLGDSWINAHLVRGHQKFAAKQFQDALADYQAALATPANLQEAAGNVSGRRGEILYWIGRAHEALGDTDAAKTAWLEAAGGSSAAADGLRRGRGGRRGGRSQAGIAAGTRVTGAASYYQALALLKTGQADRAKSLFQELVDAAGRALNSPPPIDPSPGARAPIADRVRIADAKFLAGLGQLGLGESERAKQLFTDALAVSPDHLAAKLAMNNELP
jgi:tetratricopeptide (TPR) repeat protein